VAKQVDGIAVGAVGVGALFIYSGLTGHSVLSTLHSVVKGDNPAGNDAIHGGIVAGGLAAEAAGAVSGGAIVGGAAGGAVSGALGSQIAAGAQRYIGTGYVFGGAPGAHGGLPEDRNRKDCSSLVNMVVGWDLGLGIPFYAPGTYHGQDHGPPTGAWLLWSGATTISSNPNDAQPGDLCCWQTHMGIAIGGGQMVSARSASSRPPTGQGAIAHGGPAGEALFIRRLKAVVSKGEAPAGGSQEGGH
jgi:NlpC/P60 family